MSKKKTLHGWSKIATMRKILNSVPDSERDKLLLCKDAGRRNVLHDVLKNRNLTVDKAVSLMEFIISQVSPLKRYRLMSSRDFSGATPLHYCTSFKTVRVIKRWLSQEKFEELLLIQEAAGYTPVTNVRSVEAVKEMISDISDQTKIHVMRANTIYEQNIIHIIALGGRNSKLKMLDEEGHLNAIDMKDLMRPDVCGNTPLDYMVIGQHTKMLAYVMRRINNPVTVQQLLELKNDCGVTCSSLACYEPRYLAPQRRTVYRVKMVTSLGAIFDARMLRLQSISSETGKILAFFGQVYPVTSTLIPIKFPLEQARIQSSF